MTLEEFKSMTLEARLDYLFQRNEPAPVPCPQPLAVAIGDHCRVCGTRQMYNRVDGSASPCLVCNL